jgi:hypothetical protein
VLVSSGQPNGSGNATIRLTIHIHHAIFDGLSWNLLLDDLVTVFQDGKLPIRPTFLGYLQNHLMQQSPDSIEYWRGLLHDSSPTTLRIKPESSFDRAESASKAEYIVSRAVYLGSNPHRKVTTTMSTLVQAVWSAMSGRDDILFLYLVHGRDENVANSDQIIGCCVAECPLRVRLETRMTIANLTGLVQKQAMSSTSRAHVGSNTISTRCTDWPSKERIYHHSSFVLHQTVIAKDHIVVGDTGYINVGEPIVEHKLTYDFDLAKIPSGPGELSFTLRCLSHIYSLQEAEATADAFSMTLRMLVAGNGNVGNLKQQLATLPSLPRMEAKSAR